MKGLPKIAMVLSNMFLVSMAYFPHIGLFSEIEKKGE
jgi:hypothetical protein